MLYRRGVWHCLARLRSVENHTLDKWYSYVFTKLCCWILAQASSLVGEWILALNRRVVENIDGDRFPRTVSDLGSVESLSLIHI